VRTGGQLFVDSLLANGVDFVTTVPGESFLPVLDALHESRGRPDAPRLIVTRHEAAAANMVEAAGKLTGRPSACLVTRGPGAMHAAIAVHTAFQDGTPMLLVVGQIERAVRGREAFQEMDYHAVFGTTAKLVVEITDVDRIPEIVARAIDATTAGRPGPVVVSLPEDVLFASSDREPIVAPIVASPQPAASAVESVLVAIETAERPVFVVGGPKWSQHIGELVRGFAERNRLAVAAAFRYQDALDNRSESYVGYLGLGGSAALRECVNDADLLVAIGCRLDDPTTDGFALTRPGRTDQRVIVVTDDPHEVTRSHIPAEAIIGTSGSFAEVLAGTTLRPSEGRAAWTRRLRGIHEAYTMPPDSSGDVDLAAIVRHVRDVLPDEAIFTNGAGNYTVWLQRFLGFRRHATQLAPHNGAMGYGFPASLAAAALRPGVPVVAFAGDGCFLMSSNELVTAVAEQLDLVVIVVNNGILGTIRMHQENHYPGRVIATDLRNPDFVEYTRSFGAHAARVTATAEFPAAFAAALACRGPALIEIRTDPLQITPDRRLTPTG
jgi:acetolactate synthase I/II/III large subunit